jgi:enoyl-CoA hydratase
MSRVLTRVAGGVAVITLNDPDRRNALDPGLSAELAGTIRDLDADDTVGALVVTGAGKAFCAGGNLANLASAASGNADAADLEERRRQYTSLYAPFLALREARSPTVAAVNGAAVGAGLNLALAADVRIAGRAAKFMSGFLRIGLHPGGGNTSLLTDAVGPQAAAAMTLFGETLDGEEAARVGLAWRCVDDDVLLDAATSLAASAAAYPRAATRRVKETLRLARRGDFASVLDAEVTAQIWTTTLPETAALLAERASR